IVGRLKKINAEIARKKALGKTLKKTPKKIPAKTSAKTNGKNTGKASKGTGGYQAPKGGGGVTAEFKVGKNNTITFGHGGRHLVGTGLNPNTVNRTIANDVVKQNLRKGQFNKGTVIVNGKPIEYTSYGLGNGKINIGTYYPK
ncbi:outer membrane protein, partial [Paenibacillus popilliae ATCC 14706]